MPSPLIVLFTDFGLSGPYTGQVKAVLRLGAPAAEVIDLFADAPSRDPRAAAYLLAAYCSAFPAGTIFLCVVDPGVGGDRLPIIVESGGQWFVGPDNGLFELVIRHAGGDARWWQIRDRPDRLSASFHGRDLFAPAAVRLATHGAPPEPSESIATIRRTEWPDDLAEVIYIDVYGNAMTGLRSRVVSQNAQIIVAQKTLTYAKTYSCHDSGQAFWYENANGLVEIAVNLGSAAKVLNINIGAPIVVKNTA